MKDIEKITNECSSEEDSKSKIVKSDTSLGNLRMQTKTERECFLEANLHELEKKLYAKEN